MTALKITVDGKTSVIQLGSLSPAVNQQITQAVASTAASAETATAAAATATSEAGVATAAAGTATSGAGTAVAAAGTATQQASAAQGSATTASAQSVSAASSAATATQQAGIGAAANSIFATTAAGISGTTSGKYFYVPSTSSLGSYDVWQNLSGVATATGITLPNATAAVTAGGKFVDPTQYDNSLSGIADAVIDGDGRVLEKTDPVTGAKTFLVPVAAPTMTVQSVAAQSATYGDAPVQYLSTTEYERSGRVGGKVDSTFNLIPSQAAPASSGGNCPSFSAYLNTSDTSVIAEDRSTGTRTTLSTAVPNANLQVMPDSSFQWTSTRGGALPPQGRFYAYPAEGVERAVIPYQTIVGCGDSITEQGYLQYTATTLGWSFLNYGRSGDTSIAIAARVNAVRHFFTVTGNQIPASGPVVVRHTVANLGPVEGFGFTTRSINGFLAGVLGTLTWDATALDYTFTPLATGAVVNVTGAVEFRVQLIPSGGTVEVPTYDQGVWVMLYGRNNAGATNQIMSDLTASIARIRSYSKRFVVCPTTNISSETIGTVGYQSCIEIRNAVFAMWPQNAVDVRQAMINAANLSDPTDAAAVASGIMPPSLMQSDGIHPNDAGKQVMAAAVSSFIISKGWQ